MMTRRGLVLGLAAGLVGVGLTVGTWAGDAPAPPPPDRKKLEADLNKVTGQINKMAMKIRQQEDVAPLVKAWEQATQEVDKAALAKLAAMPEHKEAVEQKMKLDKQEAELKEKIAALQKQLQEVQAELKKVNPQIAKEMRTLVRKDAELGKLDANARQAREALDKKIDEKLLADPEGKKLVEERNQLKAELEKIAPTRKPRATR